MKRSLLTQGLLAAALFFTNGAQAQGSWCSTMELAQRRAANDTRQMQDFELFLQRMEDFDRSEPTSANGTNAQTLFIPVVFHIIHNGDAVGQGENIPDSHIQSQIDALNEQFNAQDPDLANLPAAFQGLLANCQIKFCLAKFDPYGDPTTGIERLQFAQATWNTEEDIDDNLKPVTIWDPSKYLNIWSVRMGGDLTITGVLGYSSLPFFGPANADGIVGRYNIIGTMGGMSGYTQGKSITHEVGHWLGLLHPWGIQAGCGGQGDFIDDTPDQNDANFGCPTFPSVSCSASAPNGDLFMNYMDYPTDPCRNMFTLDQKDRMYSTINSTRTGMLTSAVTACFLNFDAAVVSVSFPSDTVCSNPVKPVLTIRNEGVVPITSGKIYYQLDGGSVQIYNWSGNLATQETTTLSLPDLTVSDGAHQLSFTLGNVNGEAADNLAINDNLVKNFIVQNGNSGLGIPFTADFEAVFPPSFWNVINPNNDPTWVASTATGGYGLSANCAVMNNLNFASNPGKRKDAIETEPFSFSNVQYPELKFDVAYAPYSINRADSLNVYYSLNCGRNWTKVWAQKGTDLATASPQTTLFVPTAQQWKTVSVPLVNLAGQNNVSFRFENVCGWGNAVYLDNINLANNQALSIADEVNRVNVRVVPNPASAKVALRFPATHPFTALHIYDNMGRVVYSTAINNQILEVQTQQFAEGLYFIRLSGNNTTQTEKLLIAK